MLSSKTKQIMTSFDLAAIVKELNETIIGFRLDNIYQVSPLILLITFHPRQSLLIEAGKRIHLTQFEVQKPKSPSLFCTFLRKLLNGGIVNRIQMEDFERIVSIEILSKGEAYSLIFEIFGKGNIILIDAKGVILQAFSYRRMRDRAIIRGEILKLPPPRGYNLLEITSQEFNQLKEIQGATVQALSKILGIGGLYAEELLTRANIDKKKVTSSLTTEEVDRLYITTQNLASDLKQIDPHVVIDEQGLWFDVIPFNLKKYSFFKTESYPTFNIATDEYFTKLSSEVETRASEEIVQSIDEQNRILNQQKEYLASLSRIVDENRHIGELIYLHLPELQKSFQQIAEERNRSVGWEEIIFELKKQNDQSKDSTIFLDSIDPARGILLIKIANSTFELNMRKTIFDNASFFYEEAKKTETKIEGLKHAMFETEANIEKLTKTQLKVENTEKLPVKIRNRSWFEKFHWVKSSDHFLILGGRDASTNELLIKKHIETSDLVFHSDITGAPFVLLKTEGKPPVEQTLFEAAQLAASYSRGWNGGYPSLDVYWVKPEQVSKQAPSGEFLTKGMFMIRGQKNYIRNVPLQIAIGIVEKEEELFVIGGPPSAIRSQARYWVKITPGKQGSGTIAKAIRNRIAVGASKELRDKILKVQIEEFQRFIPAGKSEIAIS